MIIIFIMTRLERRRLIGFVSRIPFTRINPWFLCDLSRMKWMKMGNRNPWRPISDEMDENGKACVVSFDPEWSLLDVLSAQNCHSRWLSPPLPIMASLLSLTIYDRFHNGIITVLLPVECRLFFFSFLSFLFSPFAHYIFRNHSPIVCFCLSFFFFFSAYVVLF